MTDDSERTRAAFRLNLEQQRKQAKELLKTARAADGAALARIAVHVPKVAKRPARVTLRLADAQHVIARELRFASWAEMKAHIRSLDQARAAIHAGHGAPDADVRTLHLRCGSDIRSTLADAGFGGDFLEVSYPYCHGPVTAGPDRFEREARFIADFAGRHMDVTYEDALAWRHEEERRLLASAADYERVVLWKEHDCFDQLVLVRCLAHYARSARPKALELVDVDHFPGRRADGAPIRFKGLGQLPAEALRLLWSRRRAVTPGQLALAVQAWDALTLDDPLPLASLMRGGAAPLPHLAFALRRLLQQLPSVRDGLSLTARLVLQVLSEQSVTLSRLLVLTDRRDPLFFATDLELLETVGRMQALSEPVLTRTPAESRSQERWQDVAAITDTGRAVLRGERDYLSLRPPARWVGGVRISPGQRVWRWDDAARRAVATEA